MDLIFCNRRNKRAESDAFDFEVDKDSKLLAKKSGFVSIQDRVANLAEQEKNADRFRQRKLGAENPNASDRLYSSKPTRQYATLQELFSSKSNLQLPHSSADNDKDANALHYKRPKIPVMKLTKDDWNVKCWEERLISHKRRQQQQLDGRLAKQTLDQTKNLRNRSPGRQLEVFQGRIDDVAKKLDKVREGAPLDEKLYELVLNKTREVKSSHDWTDLLKRELECGTHDPKQLRSAYAFGPDAKAKVMGPLGRPIGKIFQQDTADESEND